MKTVFMILAVLFMLCGFGVIAWVTLTHPDMTNLRLWIEFPAHLAGGTLMFLMGALYFAVGLKQ